MTSRERVLAALAHREPDRVPVDFGGHRSSGIMAIAYRKLKDALGLRGGGIYVYDVIQQLAIVEPPVLDALGVDTIEMGRGHLLDDTEWRDWELPDGTPCQVPGYVDLRRRGEDWFIHARDGTPLAVQKRGCLYFEQLYWPRLDRPMSDGDDFADLTTLGPRSMWTAVPHPGAHLALDAAGLAELRRRAAALRARTDRAIVALFGGNLFEVPQFYFRTDHYLTALAEQPAAVHRLTERLCELYLASLEQWLGAVGPYVDVVVFGDDLGSQCGPLISPRMYREFFQPHHARLWRRAKELAPVKVMLHSCGDLSALLDDLIAAGVDAVNPVQISCRGMDAATLKARHGDRLTFWGGGCDTHRVLPRGTPAEVAAHVRAQTATLRPGGGFVFQQVHNVMADVPPANLLAMFRAVNG